LLSQKELTASGEDATNQKIKDSEARLEESQARIAQIEGDLKSEQSKVQALESKKLEFQAALANAGTEKDHLEKNSLLFEMIE
jgi:hypothetical protein